MRNTNMISFMIQYALVIGIPVLFSVINLTAQAVDMKPLRTFILKDFINHKWANELIHYDLTFKPGECWQNSLRLTDESGNLLPIQFTDIKTHKDSSIASVTLWFILDELPTNGIRTIKLIGGNKNDTIINYTSDIKLRHTDILIDLSLTNIGNHDISNIWTDVCTSVNHLLGEPSWSNEEFMGNMPLDRTIQGRFWYEKLAPLHLFAITPRNWVNMHLNPDNPNADLVPLYNFAPSEKAEAIGCAVESLDGDTFCFQAWSSLSRYCTPSPGNACMHLRPFIAESLSPDETAKIRGLIGIHFGNRLDLKTEIISILGYVSL